jgi:hypothetical protein
MTGLIKLREEIEKLNELNSGNLHAPKPHAPVTPTTKGDPAPPLYVELTNPPTVNGVPQTALPHMGPHYRY